MEQWTELLIDRLEAAYRARFDREAALVFLNDAYQEYLLLRTQPLTEEKEQREILARFMETRDLFIRQLVDRYPSNYADVEQKIQQLKNVCQEETAPVDFDMRLHPAF